MQNMSPEEREALQVAINLYLQQGILNRVCSSTDTFLARVSGITTRRLSSLIKHHPVDIATMAGAKDVIYNSSGYLPSGRGAFGRKSGGERAKRIKPSITFVY
jgi:hypothetical protein